MSGAVGYIRDMLAFTQGGFRDACDGQTVEQLHFAPPGENHSTAWILWHAARTEDMLVNRFWQGKPDLWSAGGWAERTGLPAEGFGTGQSTDDASAVRITDLDAFRGYQAAVHANALAFLDGLSDEDIAQTLQFGGGEETLARSITLRLITHNNAHCGELNVIRGMQGLEPVMFNQEI